jgi:hypothetical protein
VWGCFAIKIGTPEEAISKKGADVTSNL